MSNIEDRVAKARFTSGAHGAGIRYSFELWNSWVRPPKAAKDLVARLEQVVQDACSPGDLKLLNEWQCKPTFYEPAGKTAPEPDGEEKEAARLACHKRALALAPWPAVVYTDWNYGDGSHSGYSVVVVEKKS